MSDQLSSGQRIRLFTVIDDFTRQCHAMTVDFSINGLRVARELTRLLDLHGKPEVIVCDNGTGYTSMAMFKWARDSDVDLRFIQSGKPGQNGFIEAFNARVRDECLNENLFSSPGEAQDVTERWRISWTPALTLDRKGILCFKAHEGYSGSRSMKIIPNRLSGRLQTAKRREKLPKRHIHTNQSHLRLAG